MKVEIRDLFAMDGCIEEEGVDMKINTEDIDMDKIRNMTMSRIRADGARGRKARRVTIIAIAAAVALIGSVSAAAYLRSIAVRTDVTENSYDDYTYENVGAEITVNALQDGEPEILGFRAGWLPETNGTGDETVAMLTESAALSCACNSDVDFDDETRESIFDEPGSEKAREVLEAQGVPVDEIGDVYTYICRTCPTSAYNVNIRGLAGCDAKQYILEEDTVLVKEAELNGMQATYMTADISGMGYCSDTMYVLLLVSEKDNAFISICVAGGFEEAEHIANELTIVHTGIRDTLTEPGTFGGILTGFGQG